MIEGIRVKILNSIPDDRGRLVEVLRNDDEIFEKFGQVYMTTTYPNIVKAWHYHKLQKDNFVCILGMIKLVVADTRESSHTRGEINEFVIGEHNLLLIQIPEEVYHGWKCIGTKEAVIINIATMSYNHKNPDEYRLPAHNNPIINYDWATKDR